MLKFFILANLFFLSLPTKSSSFIKKIPKHASLWNWMPLSWQANFFNMKKKNSIQNSLLHYGIFIAPFVFTGYQIKNRIESIYKNDSSICELFFNYKNDKQKTKIDDALINFFSKPERKNFFCKKIIESINEALRAENKYDNYVEYYKTYLKNFFSKTNHNFKSFLYLTNKKYFLETILFHFTWQLIRLKDQYDLNELKTKLENILREEELENQEVLQEVLKEGLENIYGVIQQITKYPHIDFLAKNEPNPKTIKKQVGVAIKAKQENPQEIEKIIEFTKIKNTLQKLLSINSINSNAKEIRQLHRIQKNHTLEILFNKLSIQESNKNDSFLVFIKKEIPKIISLPSISQFELLKSPWISNVFTLSLLTLNMYPWLYFSDIKNTFNPYPKYKFKNI
jgi:hypothetical protein